MGISCTEVGDCHRRGLQHGGERGPLCTFCFAQKSSSLVHPLSAAFSVSLLSKEQSCRLLACISLSVVFYAALKYDFVWGMVFVSSKEHDFKLLAHTSIWINPFSAGRGNAVWCFINIFITSHCLKEKLFPCQAFIWAPRGHSYSVYVCVHECACV